MTSNSHPKRVAERSALPLAVAALSLAAVLSSCQSPEEKKGMSRVPFNRPAKWEGKQLPGIPIR